MNTSSKIILGLAAAGVGYFLWKNKIKLQQLATKNEEAKKAAAALAAQENDPTRKQTYEDILKELSTLFLDALKKMNDQGYCGAVECPKDDSGNPIKRTDAELIERANKMALDNFGCMKKDLIRMNKEELAYLLDYLKNVWATQTPPTDVVELQKLIELSSRFPIAFAEKPCSANSPSVTSPKKQTEFLGLQMKKNDKIWA